MANSPTDDVSNADPRALRIKWQAQTPDSTYANFCNASSAW